MKKKRLWRSAASLARAKSVRFERFVTPQGNCHNRGAGYQCPRLATQKVVGPSGTLDCCNRKRCVTHAVERVTAT